MNIWNIDKEPSGATFVLSIGVHGSIGYVSVEGLLRKDAESLGIILRTVKEVSRNNALEKVRDAIGINTQ